MIRLYNDQITVALRYNLIDLRIDQEIAVHFPSSLIILVISDFAHIQTAVGSSMIIIAVCIEASANDDFLLIPAA